MVGMRFVKALPKGNTTFMVSFVITPFMSCVRNELSSFLKTKEEIFLEEDRTGGGIEGPFLEQEINAM